MSVAGALVQEAARRLLGHADIDGVIDKVTEEFRDELAALESRIGARLREHFEALGILLALDAAEDGARDVLRAFDPPAHGTIPKLGLDIEIIDDDKGDG